MAYHFKRFRIRWNQKDKKFHKIKRNRTRSKKAHMNWVRNRGKMKQALRKARIKGKITNRINKGKGIVRKLKVARARWKNIIKSDINLDSFMDRLMLTESEIYKKAKAPILEIDTKDIESMYLALRKIRDNIEFKSKDDRKDFEGWVDNSLEMLDIIKDEGSEISDTDKDFIQDILAFIEQYAEKAGLMDDEEEK